MLQGGKTVVEQQFEDLKKTKQQVAETSTSGADCPICLADDVGYQQRATVNPCMHGFCLDCLLRWLELKRTCPLCKGRVASYFYNVSADGNYNERLVPQSPPRCTDAELLRPQMVPLIDENWPRMLPLVHGSFPQGVVYPAPRRESNRESWRGRRWHRNTLTQETPSQTYRSRMSVLSRDQSEPRPYYHRMRALASAHGRHLGDTADGNAASEDTQLLLWRSHIYRNKLFALPIGSGVGSRAPNASHRRLESWIRRELQAVLQLQDVSLLASLVMGVALSFKAAERPSEQQPGANEQAVQALAPYLGADAQHFWHELRCFASAPFSLQTYDRLVRYPAAGNCQSGPAVSEPAGFELWRARSRGAADQGAEPPTNQAIDVVSRGATSLNTAQVAACPTCSTSRGATGLCLDCAEREALAEEASAPEQPQALQLRIPRIEASHSTADLTLPEPSGNAQGLANDPAMEPQAHRRQSTRPQRRVAFTLPGRAGTCSAQADGPRPRKRSAVGISTTTDQHYRVASGASVADRQSPASSSQQSAGQCQENAAASRRMDQRGHWAEAHLLSDIGQASNSDGDVQGMALGHGEMAQGPSQQQRNAFIADLAAERLRALLGENIAEKSQPRQQPEPVSEARADHSACSESLAEDVPGSCMADRSQHAAEQVIELSDSDTDDEVICLTPREHRDQSGMASQPSYNLDKRPKFIQSSSWQKMKPG